MKIALIVGALLLGGTVAHPATAAAAAAHYASPDGTGATCTQTDPCSVQTAVATAAAGDIVYLLADRGGYQLTGNLSNVAGTPISLRSFAGRADLSFTDGHLSLTAGDVSGISVHGDGSGPALQLSEATGSRMIVQAGNSQPACTLEAATLTNSVCSAVANSGTVAAVTYGDNQLRNDTLVGGAAALSVVGEGSFCGCDSATERVVNVIARASEGGTDIVVDSDGTVTATVNVRYSNFTTSQLVGPGAPSKTVIDQDSTDQSLTPSLDTDTAGNVHEAATSPTIDAGIDDKANGLHDVDGQARTMGTRTDIGADEFVSAPDTAVTSAAISPLRHKADFTFRSRGPASRFQCQLQRLGSATTSAYRSCSSPKTYRHLHKGRWRFRVRAVGPGGADVTPAKWRFRI